MFPEGFLWGVSASGFQFEMGDPRGRYIDPLTDWFRWVHDEENIRKGVVSGDLPEHGINYWELFREDHARAEALGLNAYRLNVEWSRVFPRPTYRVEIGVEERDGLAVGLDISHDDVERLDKLANHEAVKHYREVIEDLRARGFKVILNLVHFTLPLWLHDPIRARRSRLRAEPLGWLSPRFKVEFAKFAAYAAWAFGDLVDMWSTMNEPLVVAEAGYLVKEWQFPPNVSYVLAYVKVMLNIVQAHVLAYEAIKRFDRTRADPDSQSPAEVGIIHNIIPFQPFDPRRGIDVKAAKYANYVHNEWLLNAITVGWVDKDFDGRARRHEVVGFYRGKLDWLGVNYYTRGVVRGVWVPIPPIPSLPLLVRGYGFNCERRSVSREGRPTSDFGWELYPEGLREALEIVAPYRLPVIITENGVADAEDKLRATYIASHLAVLQEIVRNRRVEVRGYLHWALTDNYEWTEGFGMKFGLYAVDLATKKRYKRPSANLYAKIVGENGVPARIVERVNRYLLS